MNAMVRLVLFVSVALVGVSQVSAQSWVQLGGDINGEAAGDYSGCSVSISADGTRVAIGSEGNGGNGDYSGHVRIFEYSGGSWIQLGADIDGEAEGDYSGTSVSISADGTRVAIGAHVNDGNGADSGHVRIFEYSGGTWIQLGADIDGEAANDYSGCSVSLSTNGTRVAIGALGNDGNGVSAGHVRIFEYSDSTWNQLGADIDGEAEGDHSGYSVSISADGSRVAIGAELNDGNGVHSGHVRIFEYSAESWRQLGADIDGEAEDDRSGCSVSLSADGSLVAIGTEYNDGNGGYSGHVRIFEYSGGSWIQLGADIDGEAAGDESGRSVCLSADGGRVAIGAHFNDDNGKNAGHVRIFEYSGGTWNQLGADLDGEAADDRSGTSVSISADGSRVAIGAEYHDDNGENAGQVRIFKAAATVNIEIVGNGTVSPPSENYDLGTNLILSATADAGWLFVDWSGDITGDYTVAVTNLFVDTSKSITATFSDDADGDGILNTNETALGTDPRESDSDHDGLNDFEELYTYDINPLIRDSDADGLSDGEEVLTYGTNPKLKDTDKDGFDDFFEVSTGFDPTLGTSSPELYSTIQTAIEFQFYAATGTSYRIEATGALSNDWEVIESDIMDEGYVVHRLYSIQGQSNRYFRAKKN